MRTNDVGCFRFILKRINIITYLTTKYFPVIKLYSLFRNILKSDAK